MRAGLRIELKGWDQHGNVVWERGRIARRTPAMGAMPSGYHPVRFDADKGVCLMHAERIRVTDNRA